MIARDAANDVITLKKQADAAEQQAEAAVKARSLLHDIESKDAREEMRKNAHCSVGNTNVASIPYRVFWRNRGQYYILVYSKVVGTECCFVECTI